MSTRGWVALSLALAVYGAGATLTLACGEPRLLLGPHSKVVARAEQIIWAEAIDRRPLQRDDKAVRYTFKVLRVLRSQGGATTELDGATDPPYDGSDTTFANHTAPEFWKGLHGRMAFGGDCQMLPPHFTVGHRYLLILGPPDLKQFEHVESEDDRWLQYVAREAGRTPTAASPPAVQKDRRIVHLSSPDPDTSCLARVGGTIVSAELSDDDIRKIETLIRKRDALPIISIDRSATSGGELEAGTGVECGALSGHGRHYRLRIVHGQWTVVSSSSWVS